MSCGSPPTSFAVGPLEIRGEARGVAQEAVCGRGRRQQLVLERAQQLDRLPELGVLGGDGAEHGVAGVDQGGDVVGAGAGEAGAGPCGAGDRAGERAGVSVSACSSGVPRRERLVEVGERLR